MVKAKPFIARKVTRSTPATKPITAFSTERHALRCFISFCQENLDRDIDGLRWFASELQDQGIDPGVIAQRLKIVGKAIHLTESPAIAISRAQAAIKALEMKGLVRAFEAEKRVLGGHKKKPLVAFKELTDVLCHETDHPRDLEWRVTWYVAVCTGNRIGNIVGTTVRLSGKSLQWYPTSLKNVTGPGVSKKAREYLFKWTLPPPPLIKAYIDQHGKVPAFKSASAATCCNSWLKRHGGEMTSSSPRLFLDNRLHDEVEKGALQKSDFERLMNHSWEVHLLSYARDAEE